MAVWTLLLLLVFISAAKASEPRHVTGRVVDEKGEPVKDAAVDFGWRANDSEKDADGNMILPKSDEDAQQFWGHVGQMTPWRQAKSGADGRFSLDMPGHFFTLMALDAERKRGGLIAVPKKDDGAEVEIRLQPLVRVKGTIEGPATGERPAWTHVWTNVPEDPTRPLHATRLVGCGSFEARFEMSLPPGRYRLDANNDDADARGTLEKEITLTADTPEVDLGTLVLAPVTRLNINQQIKQSQIRGAMGDYTKHYGDKLPDWHIVDARGAAKNVQLSDFRGKWVLIDFWATDCIVCLKKDLSKLAKFYDDHQAQRDRFEVLAVCVDCSGEMKSMADVDRALDPIVKNVWGKPLPFPILLDPSMTTLERFGVPGYQTILVDPDGRLVEGDETVLAEKLKD